MRGRSILGGIYGLLFLGLVPPALLVGVGVGSRPGAFLLAGLVCGQFICLALLLRKFLATRVIVPAKRLAVQVDAFADGDFGRSVVWQGGDEIGRLAAAVERMRGRFAAGQAESLALFDGLPVGVLLLRNRVIERANQAAERLLAYPEGQLAGRSTEVLYPSREAFLDLAARAYPSVDRGATHDAELSLVRADGGSFRARLTGCAIDRSAPQDGTLWCIQPADSGAAAAAASRSGA